MSQALIRITIRRITKNGRIRRTRGNRFKDVARCSNEKYLCTDSGPVKRFHLPLKLFVCLHTQEDTQSQDFQKIVRVFQ